MLKAKDRSVTFPLKEEPHKSPLREVGDETLLAILRRQIEELDLKLQQSQRKNALLEESFRRGEELLKSANLSYERGAQAGLDPSDSAGHQATLRRNLQQIATLNSQVW